MTLTISRILHAGYVFGCEGTRIVFDPIVENPFSRNCHAFPSVAFDVAAFRAQHFDAVFISHFHDDHCSFDSLDLIDRATPLYVYCQFDELFVLLRELGFLQVYAVQVDVPIHVGAFEVIARKADDADVDSLFQIRAAGLNVLNVVDAWIDAATMPVLAAYAPWDMVLWPFQTMRETDVLAPTRAARASVTLPDEWFDQLRALNPRYVVPSSCQFVQEPWSWYNHALFPVTYRQFADEVTAALPQTQVLRLNPSVSVALDRTSLKFAAPLAWVLPQGPQDVDYAYDPTIQPPSTKAVAARFEALTATQTALVLAFCRSDLLTRYEAMELPPDSYFDAPRLWRLQLFDEAGGMQAFFYRVHGERIAATGSDDGPLGWCTDVPIAKLYAALELGESLTSMYMRINDAVFAPAIEEAIALADIIDDPLIRCLFNDNFGAYQRAQLRRLQATSPASPLPNGA